MAGDVGAARGPLRPPRARTTWPPAADRRQQPLLRLRPVQVHRLLALRAGLRRGPGHVRADHRGPRLRLARSAPGGTDFMSSECVSCGACVQACPTATLQEKSVVELGMPTRSVMTTCAYCGVGCSFKAEMRATATRGRPDGARTRTAAPTRATLRQGPLRVRLRHPPRPAMSPMVRETIDDEWREVAWDEAIATVADGLPAIQAEHGVGAIGGITSSRCTNEEVYVVQKMVRAAFGNNNVDTCARVCHSPTGYGLKQTFGTSAGTQDFKSVDQADVILVIGANPTDAHPVFASRMKRRLREGAKLIVVDPRRIDLVRTPHIEAALPPAARARHQRRGRQRDGPRRRHRGPRRPRSSCASGARTSTSGPSSSRGPRTAPRRSPRSPASPADELRAAARLYAAGPQRAPSTTASASPSTARARRW